MDQKNTPQPTPSQPAAAQKPTTLETQKIDRTTTLGRFMLAQKILNIVTTIYILGYIYRNLKVNGIEYGQYFRTVTVIPFSLIFLLSIFVNYIIENLKKNRTINTDRIETDLITSVVSILTKNPFKLALQYLWSSVKMFFKQMFLAILLAIPIMVLISLIQVLTGTNTTGNMSANF